MSRHFDLNWMIRNYSDDKTMRTEFSCNLEAHLKRNREINGGFGSSSFLCDACKAVAYYAHSNWENGEPFHLNGEQWSLTIHPLSVFPSLHKSSNYGLTSKHNISYVCGDKYVVLRKHGTVTHNLKCTKDLISKTALFLESKRDMKMFCDMNISNLILVNDQLHLKSTKSTIFTSDETGNGLQLIKLQGVILIPELDEILVTSIIQFKESVRLGKFHNKLECSVVSFYMFVLSIIRKRRYPEFMNHLMRVIFRRSEIDQIRKYQNIEGITLKINVFNILRDMGFLH